MSSETRAGGRLQSHRLKPLNESFSPLVRLVSAPVRLSMRRTRFALHLFHLGDSGFRNDIGHDTDFGCLTKDQLKQPHKAVSVPFRRYGEADRAAVEFPFRFEFAAQVNQCRPDDVDDEGRFRDLSRRYT